MNAYELADLLDFDAKTLNWGSFSNAAAMLRQLQAENDALRKTVDSLFAGLESSINLNKAQADRNEK